MVSGDLSSTPARSLPDGLVQRRLGDPCAPDLLSAARLVVRADPTVTQSPEEFATYVRNLSPPPMLLAAVDHTGAVRATSGYRVTETDATVMLVNTDPAWRRRGVGLAMTSSALRACAMAGATRACLEVTDAGASIYRSLNFRTAARASQFSRTPHPL